MKRLFLCGAMSVLIVACGNGARDAQTATDGTQAGSGGVQPSTYSAQTSAPTGAFAFAFNDIDGQPLALDQWQGKTLLVVNTATECGFTPQFEGLQALYETYRDQGLVVLGVPSNDFGGQEPRDEAEIKEFCSVNFNVTFPMTSRYQVTGDNAHPFYKWAQERLGTEAGVPTWNFHKVLVNARGEAVAGLSARVAPDSDRMKLYVESTLKGEDLPG